MTKINKQPKSAVRAISSPSTVPVIAGGRQNPVWWVTETGLVQTFN